MYRWIIVNYCLFINELMLFWDRVLRYKLDLLFKQFYANFFEQIEHQ